MAAQNNNNNNQATQQDLDAALLQRACTLLSPPLAPNAISGEVDQDSLNTVMALIKGLDSQQATLALSKALVWRVSIGSDDHADLLGAWLLVDATLTSLADRPTGRFGAIFFDEVFRSLPNLIRCKWEKSKLSASNPSNRSLIKRYDSLESKWQSTVENGGLFDSKPRRALELAFKEVKARGLRSLKHFPHLHCNDNVRLMDAIWKLRREEPRPTIARRLYRKVFGGQGEYPSEPVSEDKNLIRPLHPRLETWFNVLRENKGGCAGCDTFVHNSANCPCYRTRPTPKLDDAVRILSQRGISNPTNPDTLEVFDVIHEEMLNSRPFGNLISAFDEIRGSKTTSKQQSALYVISTYKLKPSKLRDNNKVMTLSNKIRKYFLDQHRHLELENLEQCVEILRDSFFAVDDSENPEEQLEDMVQKLKSNEMPLFVYFEKTHGRNPAAFPQTQGWESRLRRLGGQLNRLCRHCLSLKHCSIECQENTVSYDSVAATRILDRIAKVDDLKGETLSIVKEKIRALKARGERYKDDRDFLDAHKVEMALRILVSPEVERNVEKDPDALREDILRYSKVCRAYATEADTLRLHARRALAKRTEWPTTENQLIMFPESVESTLTKNGTVEPDDRGRDIIDYLKFCPKLPKEYRESVIGLCIDKDFYPPPNSSSRGGGYSEYGQFNPAMVRFCPKLIEDLLRTSGRSLLVNKVPSFATPGAPEPCIFTGSLSKASIFYERNSEETLTFLRELQRMNLSVTTFLEQQSQVAIELKNSLERAGTATAPGAHAHHSQIIQYQNVSKAAQGMDTVLEAYEELQKACHRKNQEFLEMQGAGEQQQQQQSRGGEALTQKLTQQLTVRGDDMVTFTQRPAPTVEVVDTQEEAGAAAPTIDEELAAVLDAGAAGEISAADAPVKGASSMMNGSSSTEEAPELFALVEEYYTNGTGDGLSALLERLGNKRGNSTLSPTEAQNLLGIFQKNGYSEGDDLPEEVEAVRRRALDVVNNAVAAVSADDEEPPQKRQRVEVEA